MLNLIKLFLVTIMILTTIGMRMVYAKWRLTDHLLICENATGQKIKEIKIENNEKGYLLKTSEEKSKYSYIRTKGGVSVNGEYAWVDRLEDVQSSNDYFKHSFSHYGPSGDMLWEKFGIVHSTVTTSGKIIFVTQFDDSLNQSDGFDERKVYPVVYGSTGNVIAKFSDCVSYQFWSLTPRGHYASITCGGWSDKSQIVFDCISGLHLKWKGEGNLFLSDDHTYRIIKTEYRDNRLIGKQEVIRKTIREGSVSDLFNEK